MNRKLIPLLSVLVLISAGCQAPVRPMPQEEPISPSQRTDLQTRLYSAPVPLVFASTISVLQDMGWSLDLLDQQSGLIKASTERRLESLSPKEEKITDYNLRKRTIQERGQDLYKWTRWEEMTFHIEPWGNGASRQRVVINRYGTLPSQSYEDKVNDKWYGGGRTAMINAPSRQEYEELLLPEVYAHLFQNIERAVEIRKGLTR